MDYVFHAKFEPDPEGGFHVTFPDVPEAITGGADDGGGQAQCGRGAGSGAARLPRGRPAASPGGQGKRTRSPFRSMPTMR